MTLSFQRLFRLLNHVFQIFTALTREQSFTDNSVYKASDKAELYI